MAVVPPPALRLLLFLAPDHVVSAVHAALIVRFEFVFYGSASYLLLCCTY
jgi:hypothetical protein